MKLLVWGINYAPELTGIAVYNTALCEALVGRGHSVRMLTTFSYYPAWEKRVEDRGRWCRTEEMKGVTVHRCWHYVPRRASTVRRIVHEASFVMSSVLRLLALPRPDGMVVVSPPLLLGAAAWLYGRVRGVPHVFHVQDLQPDAAVGLGMLRPSRLVRALYRLEGFAYRAAARVSGISQGMIEAFRRKGVPEGKLVLFPNGVEVPAEESLPGRGRFRARHGIAKGAFLAVYAGNLGVKQGLEVLLEVAPLVADRGVEIVICGDGARRSALEEGIRARGLRNLRLLPLQPEGAYGEMLMDADVCLITQQAGAGASFFPSKLLATLAHGRPVLAVADAESELSRALRVGGFGRAVPPGDAMAVAEALGTMASDRGVLKRWGEAGRAFVRQFAFDRVHGAFAEVIEAMVRERGGSEGSSG